ncbi:uncharacterized protein IL334_001183 [Kwoniella shivajii]|uniref:Uncharacterized protein n=1 Tax=Kwoniella shivajii TaxID=564305 RepID=A0ABZ1CR82_9TREE|nr:hypothetical protein IL334_001183 [Kwoniella shivajii]
MSLRDANCYALTLNQSKIDPSVIELTESFGPANPGNNVEARYARVRDKKDEEAYSSVIYDVLTGARLASVGYTVEKAKTRMLQLHGPDEDIPFEYTGKLSFEWTFEFEGNKYRWTREVYGKDYICSIDRKPDPRVEVCLARETTSKGPGRIQILHYNIDRFRNEIRDVRGLETILIASLLCLLDAAEDRNTPTRTSSGSSKLVKAPDPSIEKGVPPVPPRPQRVISEDDFEPENPNELIISMTSDSDENIAKANNLLEDPHVLFIVIRTKTAEAAQRALEVSLGVTRYRHHENLADLHQYVIEEEIFEGKTSITSSLGPRSGSGSKVINLNDESPVPKTPPATGKKQWSPPPNIAIYLSTIELPDLKPGRREHLKHVSSSSSNKDTNKATDIPPIPSTISSQYLNAPLPTAAPNESPSSSQHTNPSKRTSSFGRLFRTHS